MAPIHITILIRRLPHLSPAEFHTYWSEQHPQVFLSVPIVQRNITKYSQFHMNQPVADALAKDHGVPIAGFDGGVNFWGESLEEVMAVFQDEEYQRIVIPDEEKFLKRDEAVLMVGWDEDKWVDGKRVG